MATNPSVQLVGNIAPNTYISTTRKGSPVILSEPAARNPPTLHASPDGWVVQTTYKVNYQHFGTGDVLDIQEGDRLVDNDRPVGTVVLALAYTLGLQYIEVICIRPLGQASVTP